MMIKINLLPVEKKGPTKVYTQLALMGAILVVSIMMIVYLWIRQNGEIEQKNQEIAMKQKRVKELQETIAKVGRFEKKRELLQTKLNVIKEARMSQAIPVKIMMEILKVIPDQVWLETINRQGTRFTCSGNGLSLNSVGNFLTALNEDPMFTGGKLHHSEKKLVFNKDVFFFTISFQFNRELFTQRHEQSS